MKKSFIIAVWLLLLGNVLQAQKGVRFSGYFLPQLVTMRNADDLQIQRDDDYLFRYTSLGGMAGGAGITFGGGEFFALKTGILYSQQGYRYSFKRDFLTFYEATTRLEYLKVPLMLELRSGYTNRKTQFTFAAGYQLGFLTNAYSYDNIREYVAPRDPNITRYPSDFDRYKKYNGSIVIETGFDFALTRRFSANLHLRGDHSLVDAENKAVTYRITQNGATSEQLVFDPTRAPTRNITAGILFGVTYNLNPTDR